MAEPTIEVDNLRTAEDDAIDAASAAPNKAEPPDYVKDTGERSEDEPPVNWWNYWKNLVWQWLQHIVDDVMKGDYTFTGTKTFTKTSTSPNSIIIDDGRITTDAGDPVGDNELSRKKYIDDGGYLLPSNIGQAGADFNISGIGNVSITEISTNRIALIDHTNKKLTTYEFNGLTWTKIGNELTIAAISTYAKLASQAENKIAICYTAVAVSYLATYEFEGTDWTLTGNALSITGPSTTDAIWITGMGDNKVAFIDEINLELRRYEFDGSDWAKVGNGFSLAGVSTPSITYLTNDRIAYIDITNKDLRTYEFDGTDWALIGSELNISSISTNVFIRAVSSSCIVFIEESEEVLKFYRFDGSSWAQEGNLFSTPSVASVSITPLNNNFIAFIDTTQEDLRVFILIWSPRHDF